MKITFGGVFKGYNLEKQPTNKIPDAVNTAIKNLNKDSHSYTYTPTWYFGNKTDETETSYLITCECQKNNIKQIRLMTIVTSNDRSLVSFNTMVLSETFQKLFDAATKNSGMIKYIPLTFIGFELITGKGKNYYVLCQATLQDHDPYTAIIIIGEQGELIDTIRLGGLGYAFTW